MNTRRTGLKALLMLSRLGRPKTHIDYDLTNAFASFSAATGGGAAKGQRVFLAPRARALKPPRHPQGQASYYV